MSGVGSKVSALPFYHAKDNTETALEGKLGYTVCTIRGLGSNTCLPEPAVPVRYVPQPSENSNVDDRPCITAMPFNFGEFSLTQTYLSMDFSVLCYVFSINCNLCLLYFVRKDKGNQDAFMSNPFAKGDCKM